MRLRYDTPRAAGGMPLLALVLAGLWALVLGALGLVLVAVLLPLALLAAGVLWGGARLLRRRPDMALGVLQWALRRRGRRQAAPRAATAPVRARSSSRASAAGADVEDAQVLRETRGG